MSDDDGRKKLTTYARLKLQMDELHLFADLVNRGLSYSASATRVVDILRRGVKAGLHKDLTEEHLNQQEDQAARVEQFAIEQIAQGFPYLYGLLAIRIWTILEDLVDGIVLNRLNDKSLLLGLPALEALSVPFVQFLNSSEQSREELILEALKQNTKSRLKVGVGRFESLLDAVGLGGAVPDSVKRTLLELSEVRNVLVHRDGMCDNRIPERCPWLGLRAGNRVAVTSEMFGAYTLLPLWIMIESYRRNKNIEPGAEEIAQITLQEIGQKLSRYLTDVTRLPNGSE